MMNLGVKDLKSLRSLVKTYSAAYSAAALLPEGGGLVFSSFY
jgi:hypothetical protein